MSRGFTLIELIVVIAVTGIISAAIVTAYPHVRAEQKLTLAEQTLQAALRGAEQGAINEKRTDDCMTRAGAGALCSDTGVTVDPATNSLIVFADIYNAQANTYEPDQGANSNSDYKVAELAFPEGVQVEPADLTLVFQGAPPVIQLFSGLEPVSNSVPVTLRLGSATRELNIGSYGQVQRREQ